MLISSGAKALWWPFKLLDSMWNIKRDWPALFIWKWNKIKMKYLFLWWDFVEHQVYSKRRQRNKRSDGEYFVLAFIWLLFSECSGREFEWQSGCRPPVIYPFSILLLGTLDWLSAPNEFCLLPASLSFIPLLLLLPHPTFLRLHCPSASSHPFSHRSLFRLFKIEEAKWMSGRRALGDEYRNRAQSRRVELMAAKQLNSMTSIFSHCVREERGRFFFFFDYTVHVSSW